MVQPVVPSPQAATLSIPQFAPGGHLAAWAQSADQATLARINYVNDGVLSPQGTTRLVVPAGYEYLRWAIAGGTNITDARIVTPSLDQSRGTYIITPRKRGGSEMMTITAPEVFKPLQPLRLLPGENIEVQASEDGVGATQMTAVLSLGPATLPPVPAGPVIIMRCTGTTTLGVRVWTAVPLTPDNSFPTGVYALIGVVPFSVDVVAARVLFQGGGYRPGVPGVNGTELGAGSDYVFTWWELFGNYLFGYFTSQSIPQIEFFAIAGDTVETVYLICVKVG